jgi:hypothetical protein
LWRDRFGEALREVTAAALAMEFLKFSRDAEREADLWDPNADYVVRNSEFDDVKARLAALAQHHGD